MRLKESYEVTLDNQRSYLVETYSDISDHTQMHKALWKSEEQLRYFSSQLLIAQEAERRRIARDLHDELSQGFAVLKLNLARIQKKMPDGLIELKQVCEGSLAQIDSLVDHIHRISRELSPPVLEDLGLKAAFHYLVRNFVKNFGIGVVLDVSEIDNLFSKDDCIILYRILQEALTNVGKHAEATEVSVTVREQDGGLLLVVEDNGCGFDVTEICERRVSSDRLGLTTMRERAQLLGGTLELWSREGEGTHVSMRIPLRQAADAE